MCVQKYEPMKKNSHNFHYQIIEWKVCQQP